jgi:hypothetical protein
VAGKKIIGTLGPYPWIVVVAAHLDHPKADALVHKLGGDPRLVLHIAAVWGFFSQKYPEGVMPDAPFAIAALERWARWPGEVGKLVETMVEVGLLERRRKRIFVHDWVMYQAAHADRRARDRDYQARRRAELKGKARNDIDTTSAAASPSPSPSPSSSSSTSTSAFEQGDTSLRSAPINGGRATATSTRFSTQVRAPTGRASGTDPWAAATALYRTLKPAQRKVFTDEEQAARSTADSRVPDGTTLGAWRVSQQYLRVAEAEVHALTDRWRPFVGTDGTPPDCATKDGGRPK